MSEITLVLFATSGHGLPNRIIPVTSIDHAKTELDDLNDPELVYTGQVHVTNDEGVTITWEDPEFGISDLHEYFDEIEENGGYETHHEFTEDNGDFHSKLDDLFKTR